MEKMKFETPDMTQMNIEKIAALFPNCITEKKDDSGKITKAVNFDALKQILGDSIADGDESYEFTWVGKRDAMVEAAKPIRKTLRPCVEESVNFDTTENLYIEGDNLEALKLLQEGYLGKVKMIYIDPPYNTGNDFIYKDDFRMDSKKYDEESGAVDDEGNRMVQNSDSNGRFHSDWCSMIYSRLLLARNLLTDDGVIFISIDDNEQANLKKICDEVFGSDCFVGDVAWQRTYSTRNDSKGLVREIEHIVSYSRQREWMPYALPRTAEMNAMYKNPDNDVNPWTSDNPFAPGAATHQGMVYAIQHPFTGEMIYPSANACWRYQQDEMLKIMQGWGKYVLKNLDDEELRAAVCGISANDIRKNVMGIVLEDSLENAKKFAQSVYDRGQWPKFYFTKNGFGGIRRKTYLDAVGGKLPTNFWPFSETGHTDEAKKEILSLFDGKAPFDTPKPTRLLDRMLTIASEKDSLILDFFSGSATTAHAIFKKNLEDGGNRRFILVQVPEETKSPAYKNICEIGKERIRRAGAKILAEKQAEQQKSSEKNDLFDAQNVSDNNAKTLDIGFRVLKIDDSNMKDVYYSAGEVSQQNLLDQISNIKEDRTDMDLLFGCLVDWGVSLSLPIKTETIEGVTIHNVNDGDLIASFSENIPETVIRQIAAKKPLRVVFRDSSFRDAPSKINVTEIFKTLSPNTTVKVI
ncbi:MAG: site-specific DNA-methyltransferase [Fibrobacter sp.]|nr:site-specific DNA-methyltransferase [Fibrobacter sp.]